ncbi:MAG: PQQ-binding-like beta-propeller repeat protein, partial [Thermoplasmata archaeon]
MSQYMGCFSTKSSRRETNRLVCYPRVIFAILVLLAFLLTLQVSPMYHASGQEPWTQWRGSVEHTGVSSGSVPSEGKLLWRYKTDNQVQSSPVFYDGNVIIGSDDGRLYCLDGQSGDMLWKFTANDSVQATALIMGNRAYFGSLDGVFYCISLPDTSGSGGEPKELWRYDCGTAIVSSAHAYEDSVLFGCHDGGLYRLSTDGDLIWRADLGWSEIWASPLI